MIGTAVLKGGTVYIYDEDGRQQGYVSGCDELHGYTGKTVAVRKGSTIYLTTKVAAKRAT